MDRFGDVLDTLLARTEALADVVDFWGPTLPLPSFVAPLAAISAAIAAAIVAGVAASALIVLIVAAVALQFLLVEVLGVRIDFQPR